MLQLIIRLFGLKLVISIFPMSVLLLIVGLTLKVIDQSWRQ